MTKDEAIKQAWAIAESDLEYAEDYYEIENEDRYDIEVLVSDFPKVKRAIDELIEVFMDDTVNNANALIILEEEIIEAIGEYRDELERYAEERQEDGEW